MPLDKLLNFTKDVGDLSDKPNGTLTPAELKAWFDAAPNELRLAFNQLIDDLSSVVDGDSGADNIAVTAIAGLTGASVQVVLEALKTQIDSTVLGQIPDGIITDVKLSDGPTEIKQAFVAHKADDMAHGVNLKANKLQENWINATLQSGWTNVVGRELRYFKDEFGIVHVQGNIIGGTTTLSTTILFTLPTSYRPNRQLNVTSSTASSSTDVTIINLYVRTDGTVIFEPTSKASIFIHFSFRP